MGGVINFDRHNNLTVQQQHRRLANIVKIGGFITVGVGMYSAAKCHKPVLQGTMMVACAVGGYFVNHMGNVIQHIGEQPDAEPFHPSMYWQLGLLSTMPLWAAGIAKGYQMVNGTRSLEQVLTETAEEEI